MVCTNRDGETIRPALEALAAQAGQGRRVLVINGVDAATAAELDRLARQTGFSPVPTASTGLSEARNIGAGALGDEQVVAFVDDDAIVHGDWLEKLAAQWGSATPDVACIGGAVLPRFEEPPPRWVSPQINSTLSILDLGPHTQQLDPQRQDCYGSNISFEREALEGVGGFDTRLGAWGSMPLVGEETAVQRALAAAGRSIVYAGDVRVDHLVESDRLTLAGFFRRRVVVGAASARVGLMRRLEAAARAARASAGLGVAVARRDWALAGERVARLGTNLGAALAPVIRRRLRRLGWPG
ncbi:MAG: glycosyltransferase family 2 protein [Solirubrobacterales bacterium]